MQKKILKIAGSPRNPIAFTEITTDEGRVFRVPIRLEEGMTEDDLDAVVVAKVEEKEGNRGFRSNVNVPLAGGVRALFEGSVGKITQVKGTPVGDTPPVDVNPGVPVHPGGPVNPGGPGGFTPPKGPKEKIK